MRDSIWNWLGIVACVVGMRTWGSADEIAGGAESGPSVIAIGLTVADLDASVAFFSRVLDFELLEEREIAGEDIERLIGVFGVRARVARLSLGQEVIELTDFLAPEGRAVPDDSRPNDRWFQHIAIVVRDMDAAYSRLREHRVRHASSGPQRLPEWNPGAGGIEAFYFKDPDGHFLELIRFPPAKGDARWQQPSERLFLGIDHTAIVVAETEASVRFYRDALGLVIAGTSENWGPEQERLNGVFGARLRITALRGRTGPGVELLEYLSPGLGRARPEGTSANDLVAWRIDVESPSIEAAASRLRTARAGWVSPGIVRDEVSGTRALTIGDPDGHTVRVIEPRRER